MTRLPASLATLVAVAANLSASVPSAHACTCVPFTRQEYVDHADVSAIGTVIRLIADEGTG